MKMIKGPAVFLAQPANRGNSKMLAHPGRRPIVRNKILANLPLQDLAAIGEFLEPVTLKERQVLQEPGKRVEHVYFIESGLVSVRISAAGSFLETAVVGCRGAVGAPYLLGEHAPTHQFVVLFAGGALRINVEDLRWVIDERSQIRGYLSRDFRALAVHCAQSALCGVRHGLEERLACWLCLACDAVEGQVLPVTHDYLSTALGMRRTGVTETLIRFEGQRLILKTRGVLKVTDRNGLEQKACSCYGIIKGASARPEQ